MLSKNDIKYVRSLALGKYRKARGEFLAEGSKVIIEMASAGLKFKRIWSTRKLLNLPCEAEEIKASELARISLLKQPQDAMAIVEIPPPSEIGKTVVEREFVLACEGIGDPGNLGTVIRNADWFGIRYLVCSQDCADIYSPKVVQASMGSVARIHFLETDLIAWLELLRKEGSRHPISVTSLNGDNLYETEVPACGVVVFGNESKGISNAIDAMADYRLKIPRVGKAESLNVGVASGIVLAELVLKKAANPQR